MFNGLKKVEIVKVGRVWVEGKDQEFNGKKVKIQINDIFTKEAAKESIGKVVELNCKIEITESYKGYKEVTLYPYSAEIEKENTKLEEEKKALHAIEKMFVWVEEKAKEGKKYENGFTVILKNLESVNENTAKTIKDRLQKIEKEIVINKEAREFEKTKNQSYFYSSNKDNKLFIGEITKVNGKMVKVTKVNNPFWDRNAGDFEAHYDMNVGAWCYVFYFEELTTEEQETLNKEEIKKQKAEKIEKEVKENQRKLKEQELNAYRDYIRSLYERMNKDYDNRVEIENIEKYHDFFKDCNENIKIDENTKLIIRNNEVYRTCFTDYILSKDYYQITDFTKEEFYEIKSKIK